MIITVIAVGFYLVWLFPAIDPKTALSGQHNGARANRLDAIQEGILPAQDMHIFIASLQQAGPGTDPFLESGEHEWKNFLGELKMRPPRLQGILEIEGVRIALIQGSRYQEGDVVNEFTVHKVEDTMVILAKNGEYYTIHLSQ